MLGPKERQSIDRGTCTNLVLMPCILAALSFSLPLKIHTGEIVHCLFAETPRQHRVGERVSWGGNLRFQAHYGTMLGIGGCEALRIDEVNLRRLQPEQEPVATVQDPNSDLLISSAKAFRA